MSSGFWLLVEITMWRCQSCCLYLSLLKYWYPYTWVRKGKRETGGGVEKKNLCFFVPHSPISSAEERLASLISEPMNWSCCCCCCWWLRQPAPQALGLLCLYLLLHLHIMQSLPKDEFTPAFIIFTISRLEYKFLNLSRVAKYCFVWKTCCYLENPNYQPPLNTLNCTVQLWFDPLLYNIHSKKQIPMFYMFRKSGTLNSLFFLKQN